jgi:succinyl-CoA synthetase alpha subunit
MYNVSILATATVALAALRAECNSAANAVEYYRDSVYLTLGAQGKVWRRHELAVEVIARDLDNAMREFECDVAVFRTAPATEAAAAWKATVESEARLLKCLAEEIPARPAPHPWTA